MAQKKEIEMPQVMTILDDLVQHESNLNRVIHCFCPMEDTHVQLSSVCLNCEYFSGVMAPRIQQLKERLEKGAILEERYLYEMQNILSDPKNFYVKCTYPRYQQCNYVETKVEGS